MLLKMYYLSNFTFEILEVVTLEKLNCIDWKKHFPLFVLELGYSIAAALGLFMQL